MTSDPNPPQPLVDQVGELILANDRLGADWTSLAMMLIVQPGVTQAGGYYWDSTSKAWVRLRP